MTNSTILIPGQVSLLEPYKINKIVNLKFFKIFWSSRVDTYIFKWEITARFSQYYSILWVFIRLKQRQNPSFQLKMKDFLFS